MVKNFIKRFIPLDTLPLFLGVIVSNFMVYYGCRLINLNRLHYPIGWPLDDAIPFVPFFIVFYLLAFAQWAISYLVLANQEKEFCFRMFTGAMIAKWLCLLFFIALPTTMTRPEVTGTDFFSWVTKMIFAMDRPDNLFPSCHCLESWICIRVAFGSRTMGKWYRYVMTGFSILVFASVLLVKQHVFPDVIGGIAVAELGLFIARLLPLPKRWRS